MTEPFPCVDTDHFEVLADGSIRPQPWMQWRHVGGVEVPSKSGQYGVTLSTGGGAVPGGVDIFGTIGTLFGSLFSFLPGIFGAASLFNVIEQSASAAGNKNDLLHALQTSWTNDSPVDQWVYGKITRGGCRVTLQARSRGGLLVTSGYQVNTPGDPGPLVPASMVGVGADMARGGTLALGTTYGMEEIRQNRRTFALAPERTGWARLAPGDSITARAEVRFISEFWEPSTIDGGATASESSYETGGARLDLFAVPVL